MKKLRFLLAAFLVLFYASTQSHKAIGETAVELSRGLPGKTPVLFTSIEAPTKALSEYLVLSATLMSGRSLTLVERSPELTRQIDREAGYQFSGYVNDEDAVYLGRQTAAGVIIGGLLLRAGELYPLNIRAVEIEHAELCLSKTFLVKPDAFMERMMVQNQRSEWSQWLDFPLEYGKKKYENLEAEGNPAWYYDLGVSSRAATGQRARTRARENIRQVVGFQ